MKISGYLCFILGAVYATAAPVNDGFDNIEDMLNDIPTQTQNPTPAPTGGKSREFCQDKCKKDHLELVEHCKTVKFGKQHCNELADALGTPQGQEQCISICMRIG